MSHSLAKTYIRKTNTISNKKLNVKERNSEIENFVGNYLKNKNNVGVENYMKKKQKFCFFSCNFHKSVIILLFSLFKEITWIKFAIFASFNSFGEALNIFKRKDFKSSLEMIPSLSLSIIENISSSV